MVKTGGDKSKNTVNENEQNKPIQNLLNSDTRRKVGKEGVRYRDRGRCKPRERKYLESVLEYTNKQRINRCRLSQ